MKNIALSLFVIGVASVNAGSSVTSSSSSGSASGAGLVNGSGALTQLQAAGSARLIAAQGGTVAGGVSSQGWGARNNGDFGADCDDEDLEVCHHDIHIG